MIRWISCFVIALNLYAHKVEVIAKVPVELKILIDSYHLMDDKLFKKQALTALQKLEQTLGQLEQAMEFLLIKNEIYKALIEYPHPLMATHTAKNSSLAAFDSFFKKHKNQLLPLGQWISEAVLTELKQVPDIPLAHSFATSKMETRSRVLKAWFNNLQGKSAAEINLYFEQVMVAMINHLHKRLAVFLEYSQDFRRPQKIPVLRINDLPLPKEKSSPSPEVKNIEKGIKDSSNPEQKPNWKPRKEG